MISIILDVNNYEIKRYKGNRFVCANANGGAGVTGRGRTPIKAAERAAGRIFHHNSAYYLRFVSNTLQNSDLMELGL